MSRYPTHVRKRKSVVAVIAVAVVTALSGSTLRAAPAPAAAPPAQIPGIANGPPLTLGESAEDTYELNYVGITHYESGGYTGANGTYIPRMEYWEGYRGKYKLKLGVREFYDAVARPDLNRQSRVHMIITSSVLVAGLGLGIGGGIYALREHSAGRAPKWSLVASTSGVILALLAGAMSFQPASEAEAYRLARTYNDNLRARLGLAPVIEDPTQPVVSRRPIQRRIAVVPAIDQQGGGLMLMGLF